MHLNGEAKYLEEYTQLRELSNAYSRRLHKLKLQAATYGIDCPPHVANEIEDIEKNLAGLEEQLNNDKLPYTEAHNKLEQLNQDIENINDKLQAVEEVQAGIKEVKEEIHILEQKILAAIQAQNHEKIPELGAALGNAIAALESRRRKSLEVSKYHETGLESYKRGMELFDKGDHKQAMQEFQSAEMSFRETVDGAQKTDSNLPLYLTDLGNSLTMQNRVTDAIPFYEQAIQLSGQYEAAVKELVKRLVNIGNKQISSKQFTNAIDSLEYALVLSPDDETAQHKLALALNEEANAKLTNKPTQLDWDYARDLMSQAIFYDPTVQQYQKNLQIMQGGTNRPNVVFLAENKENPPTPNDATYFEVWYSDELPDNIRYWIDLILPQFRELLSDPPKKHCPIHFWWLNEKNSKIITQLKEWSISQPNIATSISWNNQHYIVLNASFFVQIEDPRTIVGLLAYHLTQVAFTEIGATSHLPNSGVSAVTLTSSIQIADLLTIYKGLGLFLLQSRKYLEQRADGGFEGDYPGLTPIQIKRYLRRAREKEAKNKINAGAELKRQDKEDANDQFAAAIRIWKRIAQEDPNYAFAWYELSIAYGWNGDQDKAVQAAQRAARLDTNPKYRQRLNKLQMSNEKEARKFINDGAEFDKLGDQENARGCFKQAEMIWRGHLNSYFDVACIHYELA